MTRHSHDDRYNKEPELAEGTEAAVAAALAPYPNLEAKALDAVVDETGVTTVTVGYKTGDGVVHIIEVVVDAAGTATAGEERQPKEEKHEKKGH